MWGGGIICIEGGRKILL